METRIRLQRFLRDAGLASRRGAEKFITDGRVAVNGLVVTELGSTVDPVRDSVAVDGQRIEQQEKVLYLFHKPVGVVTTMSDPQGRPSVGEYVDSLATRVFPVGRLDADVFGLLLLTNDGDFAERLMHPRFEEPRVYVAELRGAVSEEVCEEALKGVSLDGKKAFAQSMRVLGPKDPALRYVKGLWSPQAAQGKSSVVELIVKEGRHHFVKKFCGALGHPVIQLGRIAFGPYELGKLKTGTIKKVPFSK